MGQVGALPGRSLHGQPEEGAGEAAEAGQGQERDQQRGGVRQAAGWARLRWVHVVVLVCVWLVVALYICGQMSNAGQGQPRAVAVVVRLLVECACGCCPLRCTESGRPSAKELRYYRAQLCVHVSICILCVHVLTGGDGDADDEEGGEGVVASNRGGDKQAAAGGEDDEERPDEAAEDEEVGPK